MHRIIPQVLGMLRRGQNNSRKKHRILPQVLNNSRATLRTGPPGATPFPSSNNVPPWLQHVSFTSSNDQARTRLLRLPTKRPATSHNKVSTHQPGTSSPAWPRRRTSMPNQGIQRGDGNVSPPALAMSAPKGCYSQLLPQFPKRSCTPKQAPLPAEPSLASLLPSTYNCLMTTFVLPSSADYACPYPLFLAAAIVVATLTPSATTGLHAQPPAI